MGLAINRLAAGPIILLSGASLVACANQPDVSVDVAQTIVFSTAVPTTAWEALVLASPYPFEYPLSETFSSSLDGLYEKVDPSPPQWWTCLRCADYRLSGGIWKLQFDRGVMRIYYDVTTWRTIASFTVEGDRLRIFNDPFCPHDLGEYQWSREGGSLVLNNLSDDECAFGLRGINLEAQAWMECDGEGAVACPEGDAVPAGETPANLDVTVRVIGGNSHYFATPPQTFAVPNSANIPPPQGIEVTYDENAIGYGTYRILWPGGNWSQATTSVPFTHIGVQLWGSGHQGWARVLFDGTEVWRGLPSTLGSRAHYFGGYIEVSGFEPGTHTIRVEEMGVDYRPVTVSAYGFSSREAVK